MKRIIGIGLVVGIIIFAGGCRSPVDENWGRSSETTMNRQIANPDAPNPDGPLETLDPETGKRVADRYYEGQEKQKQRVAPAAIVSGN